MSFETISKFKSTNATLFQIFNNLRFTKYCILSGDRLRIRDSKYKMLNQLANDLGGDKGQSYLDIKGTLKIVSENTYCPSCLGVIQQFNKMFPNVKLKLIDGVR